MKRAARFLLASLLLLQLVVGVRAADSVLSVSGAQGRVGDVVYLTVTLNQPVVGNTLGISYTYDAAVLEPLPDRCTWAEKGVIQDFGDEGNGVWTVEVAKQLSGDLFTLAFRLKAVPQAGNTPVTCRVTVKNGPQEMGKFSATGSVAVICEHQFPDTWENDSNIGHARRCGLCGSIQTQSHVWSEVVISSHPTDPALRLHTYTCTVCGGQRQTVLPAEQTMPVQTQPPHTQPPHTQGSTLPPFTQPENTAPPVETWVETVPEWTRPPETTPWQQPDPTYTQPEATRPPAAGAHTTPAPTHTIPSNAPQLTTVPPGPEDTAPEGTPGPTPGASDPGDGGQPPQGSDPVSSGGDAYPTDHTHGEQTLPTTAHDHDHEDPAFSGERNTGSVVLILLAVLTAGVCLALYVIKRK